MPSTSKLLTAALAASAVLAAAPAAHAATADLSVTAVNAGGGGVRVYPQQMADGSLTLALPHDGVARDVYLDATGSVDASWYAFDSDGDGWYDGPYGAGGRSPRRLFPHPVLRQDVTSAVAINGDSRTRVELRWRLAYLPEAHLTAPASVPERRGATFDASDSVAWWTATVPRAPARFEWDLEDGKGFSRTTTSATLVRSFALGARHPCVRVRAVDSSGARSMPAEACTTVTIAAQINLPPITAPRPPVVLPNPRAPIPMPVPVA